MLGAIAANRRRASLSVPLFRVWDDHASAYGVNVTGITDPPTFQFVLGSDVGEGDYVEFQIDTANTFSTGNLRDEERVLGWDGTNFIFEDPATNAPLNFSIQTGLTPSTIYYARRRIRRNYGDKSIYSPWSTICSLSTTAAGYTFAWNSANKSTWDSANQVLSNSNRTWTVPTADSGANSSIRSTLNITGNGTKVYFEFNPDVWDSTGSAGLLGVATDTYGGAGSPGSLASVGDALANLSQTAGLVGYGADLYVANAYVATPAGVDISPVNHAIGFAIQVNASNMTLWVLKDGVCGHGNPVAGTGGYTLPFTQVRPIAALNPNAGTAQGVTINTLAAATSRAPSGFTPAGA